MSTIKVGTLLAADGTTTTQPSIPALDQRMAKAWVNFNGVGTVAIRDSYNVSSLTDIAVGRWYVNFTTAMTDANYATVASALGTTTGSNRVGTASAVSTTQAYVNAMVASTGANNDTAYTSLTVFSN